MQELVRIGTDRVLDLHLVAGGKRDHQIVRGRAGLGNPGDGRIRRGKVGEHHRILGAIVKEVGDVEHVDAVAAGEHHRIGAGARNDGVVARPAIDHIRARATIDPVDAGAAEDRVRAAQPVQAVVAVAAEDRVVAGVALDRVIAGRLVRGNRGLAQLVRRQRRAVALEFDKVDEAVDIGRKTAENRHLIAIGERDHQVLGVAPVRADPGDRGIRQIVVGEDQPVLRAIVRRVGILDFVDPVILREDVGICAGPTHEAVIALTAGQRVIAALTVQKIVADTACQRVVICRADEVRHRAPPLPNILRGRVGQHGLPDSVFRGTPLPFREFTIPLTLS